MRFRAVFSVKNPNRLRLSVAGEQKAQKVFLSGTRNSSTFSVGANARTGSPHTRLSSDAGQIL
jgi:hypothetical protein